MSTPSNGGTGVLRGAVAGHTRREAILAVGALGAGPLLAACGGGQPAAEGIKRYAGESAAVVAAFGGSQAELDMRKAQVDAFARKFPKVAVEFQPITGNRFQWLTTRFAGGTPPDVVYMNEQNQNPIDAQGGLVDLTPYVRADKELKPELYFKDLWEGGKWGGRLLSIPQEVSPIVLYYNVGVFQKAGVPPPTDTWTWTDLQSAALRLARTPVDGSSAAWGFNAQGGWTRFAPFVFANGGDMMDKERKRMTLSSPENRETFQFLVDLIHRHKVAPPPGTQLPGNPFQTGALAMDNAGAWNVAPFNVFAKGDPSFTFDVVRHPRKKFTLGTAATLIYGIAKPSKVPDATWELIKFMCLREGQEFVAKATFAVPSLNDPKLLETFTTANPQPKNAKVFIDQAKELRMDWFGPKFQDIQREFTAAFEPMWKGEKPVADALKDADGRINKTVLGVG